MAPSVSYRRQVVRLVGVVLARTEARLGPAVRACPAWNPGRWSGTRWPGRTVKGRRTLVAVPVAVETFPLTAGGSRSATSR